MSTLCQHGNIIDLSSGLSCAKCVSDEDVRKGAAALQRLFIMRDTDLPMPSFDNLSRAVLETVLNK